MKKQIYILALATSIICWSCNDYLDVETKDRITDEDLLASDGGIDAYMAGQYYNIPMEDFMYDFTNGFNIPRCDGGKTNMISGPEAVHTEWGDHIGETNRYNDWERLYKDIRGFNELKQNIPLMKPSDPATIDKVTGEYYFMMAYTYFALAKRYGGVSIIDSLQEFTGDYEAVKVPRSTEVDTWKFILKMCDEAANHLPDATTQERATKWTAYALKSRAALFAASVGKFWNKDGAGITGKAVDQKLVGGFTHEDISFFYQECINASAQVIKSKKFALYGENPESPEIAAQNYNKIFTNGKGMSEVIFLRDYTYPGIAHNMGKWHEPNQLSTEYGGRCCPTLDIVESYAMIDPSTKAATYDVKLETTTNGQENYASYNFNGNVSYKQYENLSDIYANRDPRLYASVILPNTLWGGKTIIIQGGIVKNDGSAIWMANDPYEFNGQTYYGKGDASEGNFSGWVTNQSNGTRSGFLLKKYLEGANDQTWDQNTTPFVDIRYAEVLLNYAEAVAESGLADAPDCITAREALNMVHHRAGFMDNTECSPEKVRYERKAEFALEYSSVWDYYRRRELHTIFNNTNQRTGLVPMLDFTSGSKKYIFVRTYVEPGNGPKTFETKAYYRPIPGIEGNSLVQNPNY